MGSWLNLLGKELVLIFLVLSYVFGYQYNKRYTNPLMNPFHETVYALPNVRSERQTRNSVITNRLLTKRADICKQTFYGNTPNIVAAQNKACCRPPCSASVNRVLLNTKNYLTNTRVRPRTSKADLDYSINNRLNERYFRSLPAFDNVLKRKVKSETDDILNSIGGDLKRIESKIIKKASKVIEPPSMSTDELIKNLKSMKMGDTHLADSILLQEGQHKVAKTVKMSHSNILENTFHHLLNKHHAVLHPKTEIKAADIIKDIEQKNNEPEDELEKPALLSFFKDEGEPILNQTEDEHGGEFTEDPFQDRQSTYRVIFTRKPNHSRQFRRIREPGVE